MKLNETQQKALDLIKAGHNVLLSGKAGSGKSTVVGFISEYLRSNFISHALTASTGIAAVHIGGCTIHRFLGTGICGSIKEVEGRYIEIPDKKVIIVDEVSMIDGHYLDMMDYVLRKEFNHTRPFGGKQIVLIGDFAQLPPVKERSKLAKSDAFVEGNFRKIFLQTVIRQKNPEFQKHLDCIRKLDYNEETLAYFNQRVGAEIENFIELDPYNKGAYFKNLARIKELEGESRPYFAKMRGDERGREALIKMNAFDEKLFLKLNARVLLTKNNSDLDIVNGDLGKVVKMEPSSISVLVDRTECVVKIPKVTYEYLDKNGNVQAEGRQLPIKLGYAVTIHKCQGLTLPKVKASLHSIFDPAQLYVALSRVRELEDLSLIKPITGKVRKR